MVYRSEDVKWYELGKYSGEDESDGSFWTATSAIIIQFESIDGRRDGEGGLVSDERQRPTYGETEGADDPNDVIGDHKRWRLEVEHSNRTWGTTACYDIDCIERICEQDASSCACERCPNRGYDDEQEQRYCEECESWMHRRCLAREAETVKSELIYTVFKETTDDEDFIRGVSRPIARGGVHKTFGNGNEVVKVREAWRRLESGADVRGWDEDVNTYALWPEDEGTRYYSCPGCEEHWV
ncbi:hypothetical protein EV363DRAFT_1302554 [Boletus edulis]|nr:hypothetical protein EV363DRAFT_1302554 [Boletus edulis]